MRILVASTACPGVPPMLAENVTVTPHVAVATEQAARSIAERVTANIERLRRGEPISEP